jgi:hypothetical protein
MPRRLHVVGEQGDDAVDVVGFPGLGELGDESLFGRGVRWRGWFGLSGCWLMALECGVGAF